MNLKKKEFKWCNRLNVIFGYCVLKYFNLWGKVFGEVFIFN